MQPRSVPVSRLACAVSIGLHKRADLRRGMVLLSLNTHQPPFPRAVLLEVDDFRMLGKFLGTLAQIVAICILPSPFTIAFHAVYIRMGLTDP